MKTFLYPAIIALLFWTGCSVTAPSVDEYTIAIPSSVQTHPKQDQTSGTITVSAIKTIPSLDSKALYYLQPNGENTPYLYTRWSDTPSTLIRRSLIWNLENSGLFSVVLPSGSGIHTDLLFESDLNAFYHRFDGKRSYGSIDMTCRIIDTSTRTLLASKRFSVETAAPSDDGKGGAAALTEAVSQLNLQITEWIRTTLKEKL